jgi:SAM-dependent methyltransferase
MLGTAKIAAEDRRDLARRMMNYYRTNEGYFDEVKAIAVERPSEEELVMFRALVAKRAVESEPRVLELGCGRCESAPTLMRMLGGGQFTGVEASPAAARFAREHNPSFTIHEGDISSLPFQSGSFDIVFMNYVLEHTCDPRRVIDEALRVLGPRGLLGMIVPVSDLPWMTPQSLRHKRELPFLVRYTLERWVHLLKLRYLDEYFAFPIVAEPLVLAQPGTPFIADDDQVYIGSSFELIKYMRHRGAEIAFQTGRDIETYIRNGRRPAVDLIRSCVFQGIRASLGAPRQDAFTTTTTLVARKA